MAIHAATDRQATINSVDLSAWATDVSVEVSIPEIDVTATQDTAMRRLAGKPSYTARVELLADDAASATGVTIDALIGVAPFACEFRPDKDVATYYSGNWILTSFEPIPGGTGNDAAKSVAVFASDGAIARTQAP